MEIKEDENTYDIDQKFIDKIPDRQLNDEIEASGDSMIKLANEFQQDEDEKELNELISIKSNTKSKQIEASKEIEIEVDLSVQTFKNNEVNQSSGSTAK